MVYGYVRVSSNTQNIDRQMEELFRLGLTKKFIYVDRQSGKDFNRVNYQRLKKKLRKGDLLIIKSIDRLGRNYDMIINEWASITKIIEADIFVIDFPLLDTRVENKNLMGKFISDIVLQILSFVAQNERENIKSRQAEGIKLAKERGVHMGRPKYIITDEFKLIAKKYINKEISMLQAIKQLNISKVTFLKYLKLC